MVTIDTYLIMTGITVLDVTLERKIFCLQITHMLVLSQMIIMFLQHCCKKSKRPSGEMMFISS